MRYRRLGRTDLRVSEISLGTVEIGLDYGIGTNGIAHRPEETEAVRLLHRALDLGLNLIDTARVYGGSEALIGKAMSNHRNEFILCSKVACYAGENLTRAALRDKVNESVHASLNALRTDRIDIIMLHSATAEVIQAGQIVGILEDLKKEGHVLWVGASVYGNEAALGALASGSYDCLQVACSALDRRPELSVWPEAQRTGIGIVARSVLLKGALTPRHRHLPESLTGLKVAVTRLEEVAREAMMDLPELAYRYVLSHTLPHTALVGASAVEEVEAAARFAEAGPLPENVIARIREIEVENESCLNPGTWGPG